MILPDSGIDGLAFLQSAITWLSPTIVPLVSGAVAAEFVWLSLKWAKTIK